MSMVLAPLSWHERAKVFAEHAKTKDPEREPHYFDAAVLNMKTSLMMAVEEQEMTAEEATTFETEALSALEVHHV